MVTSAVVSGVGLLIVLAFAAGASADTARQRTARRHLADEVRRLRLERQRLSEQQRRTVREQHRLAERQRQLLRMIRRNKKQGPGRNAPPSGG